MILLALAILLDPIMNNGRFTRAIREEFAAYHWTEKQVRQTEKLFERERDRQRKLR